ncbi:hypothetical protein RUM43_008375 [Polyplax serrata]|uniref:Glutamate [NMDA] receptor subunit 3A n=1 Tax=Polyplax serrata TaxID=468196 RepID=A0AAN8S2F0_POLSC
MSKLVDYSIKALEKPVKGKIDMKMLMPKIPKYIQVYVAVAFSEREFPSYSKVFNKTLSSIPNSFLIPDSLNRHYNISVSPLFFVLPNSGRFSSSIYEVMCNSFDRKRVVAILVIGESPAAFTVSLAAVTSNIPVLWARGGIPSPPGNLQQQDPLEIRLEPSEIQLLEAVRGVFLATHWHSFTVMAAPSLAARCASILDQPPLNPKVVPITQNPHNIFRKLADVSRSTRGVVLLLCDLSDAILVMNVAKRLSMIDGHFVWIWLDTTTKPASFLTLPSMSSQNYTQKFTRYLKKTTDSAIKNEGFLYQNDDVNKATENVKKESIERKISRVDANKVDKKPNPGSLLKTRRRRQVTSQQRAATKTETGNGKNVKVKENDKDNKESKESGAEEVKTAKSRGGPPRHPKEENPRGGPSGLFRGSSPDKVELINSRVKVTRRKYDNDKENSDDKTWTKFASMDYLNDFAVQLDYPSDKEEIDDVQVPTSKAWGKITEHFPIRTSGEKENEENLRGTNLPIGLLSVKPEPMKLDRHLLKGSVRLLVSSLHTVLKKSADWLSILDTDSSCWIRPTSMNKNFSEMYAKEIRQAVKESLSGQPQFQEGDRADRSLLANFQILNLVPEKFHINFNNDDNVIEDAVLYWRQVGKVLGKSAHLNTIVWPGGDLVASALSARTRSVFRIVTALAPPFVMEGALDEDGQCLRGVICHRVLNSDKDNLTLVFNEMETQERMEDEVEELGGDDRTEKPFKFIDNSYFEYHATKYKYKSSCCYGLAMDLLENVAQELEFEFHLYIIPDGAYGARSHVWEQGSPRSKWNGIVGDLVSGAAHMSFAALSVSKQRSQVIDFSTPYFFSGVSFLAAPTHKSEVPLLAFLLPFSTELWIAIFTSLNITAMAVACYEWLSPFGLNPWGRQRSRNFSIASALWVMWGLLCGHLVAFKAPKSWPNKFLINVWGGFSVIFVASYTANIAALIAGLFFHNSVSDYHDRSLLTQRVGAPKSSSADYYIHRANQHLWEHMQKYSFDDLETGISLLRNGSLDILVADTPILDYYRATDHGCKLQKIVEAINEDTYAIGMNKGFPLKESISAVISKYSNNGYMDILTEKWYGGLPCFKMTPSVELTDVGQPRPLGVAAVAGVFLLLGLGMVVGVLILIMEHLFYRYTLPVLRHQPKGTIWRSRNIMFFSQKLYRFINCVELVSPHHAARELVHTLRQGQITSLFQKSVKRKEHEQRRRRKSKAQFFEMIQEIRRVQQEEKEEPKQGQNIPAGVECSPKGQLRGFLTSPRSLKHFCSSKSTVSPQISLDMADPLNPSEVLQHRRSSKSPSRLDIRRFSKELFSLPRSPKSPRVQSSTSLDTRRLSSDLDDGRGKGELKTPKGSEIRLSAKDIRIQTSKAIGRRLSKDASSWLTSSPPDLNSRRKSHLDVMHAKSLSVSENVLDETPHCALDFKGSSGCDKEKVSSSILLTPVMSKSATLRLASGGGLDTSKLARVRPRLPSPPTSPGEEFRNNRTPKINVSDAENFNLYETINLKEESKAKKTVKGSHCRSRSLDNKHLSFETTIVNIATSGDDSIGASNSHTVSYATLQHKRLTRDDDRAKPNTLNGKCFSVKSVNTSKERSSGVAERVHEVRSPLAKKGSSQSAENKNSGLQGVSMEKKIWETKCEPVKDIYSIYAEPQKLKKDKREDLSGTPVKPTDTTGKPKVPPKSAALKLKQVRACSAPETSYQTNPPSIFYVTEEPATKPHGIEYNYYSEHRGFRKSDSFPERHQEMECSERCFGTHSMSRTCRGTVQGQHQQSKQQRQESGSRNNFMSRRSRSVPEQRFTLSYCESGKGGTTRGKSETPILVLEQWSRSLDVPPTKSPGILKNKRKGNGRSKEEPPSPPERRKSRQDSSKTELIQMKKQRQGHLEPP